MRVFSSKATLRQGPYVIFHKNVELIGKTSWKSQTQLHEWYDDILRVTFYLMSDAFQGVRLGVWDYDINGDDALGMVTLSREELLSLTASRRRSFRIPIHLQRSAR